MGMATGQGLIPETEVNSGGRKEKRSNSEKVSMKSLRNYVFVYILCMKPLLPFPNTKEREKKLKRYDWLSTGGKEKPPILRSILRLGVSHFSERTDISENCRDK